MEELFISVAAAAALVLEGLAIIAVCCGALESVCGVFGYFAGWNRRPGCRRGIWMSFARWLMLALEFALGADIIRTAIAPTWDELGQLAVIAVIRTGLGFFLEKDIDAVREGAEPEPAAPPPGGAI